MQTRTQGFQLSELTVVVAVVGMLAAIAVPSVLRATARQRVRLAAHEIAATLRLGRATAIRYSANVGVKFRTSDDGEVTYTLYLDGDGDGVLSRDIETGVDVPLGTEERLTYLGPGVGFGFPGGRAPRDPGDPRRRLDRLDDPIRFNRSDIAAFSNLGGSTPGSLYLTDHHRELAVVRVLGQTGRLRIMVYDIDEERWR